MWSWQRKQSSANHVVLYDANNTWQKVTSQLPEFVNDVCGQDLEETATRYAEGVFLRSVKQGVEKYDKKVKTPKPGELIAIQTGNLTLKIKKQ